MAIEKIPYNQTPMPKPPKGKLIKVGTITSKDGAVVCKDYFGEHQHDGAVLFTSVRSADGATQWYYSKPATCLGGRR